MENENLKGFNISDQVCWFQILAEYFCLSLGGGKLQIFQTEAHKKKIPWRNDIVMNKEEVSLELNWWKSLKVGAHQSQWDSLSANHERVYKKKIVPIYSRCWDISSDKWKRWPTAGAKGKVTGSPKSL